MKEEGEIVLYQPDEVVKLEVRLENETVWLNRLQLAELFDRDVKTIGKHINNALKEELVGLATVANFATVQKEGNRIVTRQVEYYNLDMILSIGYRVKSQRGVEFRRWSNQVLKEYLLKGYAINQRLNNIEQKMDEKFIQLEQTVSEHSKQIDFFVRTSLPPVEGIFYDGQIFDAYKFATGLIKTARHSLVLIDNYVDETVLIMLSKRAKGVRATVYTSKITSQLQLDIHKHNEQYPPVDIHTCKHCHDRFLIIDNQDVYHLGASLKDLGKKMFAFSHLAIPAETITGWL